MESVSILNVSDVSTKINNIKDYGINTLLWATYSEVYNFYYKPVKTKDTKSVFVVNEDNRFRLPTAVWKGNSFYLSDDFKTHIIHEIGNNNGGEDGGYLFIDYINSNLTFYTDYTLYESIEYNYNTIINTLIGIADDDDNYIIKQIVYLLYKIRSTYENDSITYDSTNKKAMSYKNPQHLMLEYYNFVNMVGSHIFNFVIYNNELARLVKESTNKKSKVFHIDNTNPQLKKNIDDIFNIIFKAVAIEYETDILIKTNDILTDDLIEKFSYILGYCSFNDADTKNYNGGPNKLPKFYLLENIDTQKYFWFTSLDEYNNYKDTINISGYSDMSGFGISKFYFKVLDVIFNATPTNPAVYRGIDGNNYININSMTKDDYNRFNNTINKENANKEEYKNNNNLTIKTWYDYLMLPGKYYDYNPFNDSSYNPNSLPFPGILDKNIYKCDEDKNARIDLYNNSYTYIIKGDAINFLALFEDCEEPSNENSFEENSSTANSSKANSSKEKSQFQNTTQTEIEQDLRTVAGSNVAIGVEAGLLNNSSNPNKKSNIGMIVGSVTGGVVLIGLILFLVLKKQRKFKKKSQLKQKPQPKSQLKLKSQLNKKGKK